MNLKRYFAKQDSPFFKMGEEIKNRYDISRFLHWLTGDEFCDPPPEWYPEYIGIIKEEKKMNKFEDIFIPIACLILLALLISAPIFIAKNCEDGFEKSQENAKKYFKEHGFLGEHSLNKIESSNQISGKFSGGYFLVAGSISGDFKANKNYSFYWEISENNFIITTIPASKFRFTIDDSKINPTVEFIFDLRGFYEKPVDKPNKYIEEDRWLSEVIIRISRKDFDKEVLNESQD